MKLFFFKDFIAEKREGHNFTQHLWKKISNPPQFSGSQTASNLVILMNLFNLSSLINNLKPLKSTWKENRSQKLKELGYPLDVCVIFFLEIVICNLYFHFLSPFLFLFPLTFCWILLVLQPFCFTFPLLYLQQLEREFIWEYQFTEIIISFVKKITLLGKLREIAQ